MTTGWKTNLALACCVGIWACSDPPGAGAGDVMVTPDVAVVDVPVPDVGSPEPDGPPEVSVDLGTPPPTVVGLAIHPSTLALQVAQGEQTPLGLEVVLVYSDDTEVLVTDEVIWTFSDTAIAGVDDDNQPVATGLFSGQVLVVVVHQGLHAQCSVSISLILPDPVLTEGMNGSQVSAFEAGEIWEEEDAPTWSYPLEGAVMPRGLLPPVIQWDAGPSAWFRLRLENTQGFTVTVYTTSSSYQPTREHWEALGVVAGGPVTLELVGATSLEPDDPRHVAPIRQVVLADATLDGSVYYWEVKGGSIMRLDTYDLTPAAEPVFPEGGACRGCHTLSRDGSRLAFVYNAKGSGDVGVAWSQSPDPPILGAGSGAYGSQMAFGPTADHLVIANMERMFLADVTPGQENGYSVMQDIVVLDDPSLERVETPAWSPDGSALVYAYSPYVVDGTDLHLRFWDDETQTFGAPAVILSKTDVPGRKHLGYPTWSPDSSWIVTKAATTFMEKAPFPLILLHTGSGAWTELTQGSPAEYSHGQPSFSPFMEGGYYWLLFYSNRPYGNIKPDARKQLWVMAIHMDGTTEVDPSHAPFWLPGQDVTTTNLSGYWSNPVCSYEGELCLGNDDCCIGHLCSFDPVLEMGFCSPTGCTVPGEYCDAKGENCCEDYSCQQNLSGTFSCQPD